MSIALQNYGIIFQIRSFQFDFFIVRELSNVAFEFSLQIFVDVGDFITPNGNFDDFIVTVIKAIIRFVHVFDGMPTYEAQQAQF